MDANTTITICNNSINCVNTTATIHETQYYTLVEQMLIIVAGVLLSIITISGNVLVFVAYYVNSRLQTVTNMFICSLAATDIAVGVFSINVYTVYIVFKRWPLGTIVCDIWLCLDFVLLQATIIHLMIICIDRYFSVRTPMKYGLRRTKYRAKIVILIAWIIAFFQWVPWIISYPFMIGERTVHVEEACYVRFLFENYYAAIITAIASYFAPVLVLTALYIHVYFLISRKVKIYNRIKLNIPKAKIEENKVISVVKPRETSLVKRTSIYKVNNLLMANTATASVLDIGQPSGLKDVKKVSNRMINVKKEKAISFWKITLLLKQKKLTTMQVLIFSAFVISWLPYFTISLLSQFRRDWLPDYVWYCCYMMCYINSTINPLCYALGNRDFQRTFQKLLTRKSRRVGTAKTTV